jgi:UDP-galactopyranose mutase
MTRFARSYRVLYWEEPVYDVSEPNLKVEVCPRSGVIVLQPALPPGQDDDRYTSMLKQLLEDYLGAPPVGLVRWYYTPMMIGFSRDLPAACTVYDCMDELANFLMAPPQLKAREAELMRAADVVFTGGYSLYEAKRDHHPNIHPFPSSVDRDHFARARLKPALPVDLQAIAEPRLGFYGVVDERMDLALLAAIADARPEWSFIIIGPVVKIDPASLPRRPNLHFLGGRSYDVLPDYLAGWAVALMPFAINESTRFISPTKTPEYLAAGKPVVSTPITDVVRQYATLAGVRIAGSAEEFVAACEAALTPGGLEPGWLEQTDRVLADMSWEASFASMNKLIAQAIERRESSVRPQTTSPSAARIVGRARAYDYLVVGAGFAGSTLAERLAQGLGKRVLVIDRRPHIGGNAFDEKDAAGVLMHRYGPHIFHTNSDEIVDYLSRFTRWRPYEHRVLAAFSDGMRVPVPINRTTLNTLYGLELRTDEDAAEFLASQSEPVGQIRTSEDIVVSSVGRDLYERFFRGYTRKQWGLDPAELDKSVTARVPTRLNTDDRYFTDRFQWMPADGYTRMFEAMLDHPNITVETGVDFKELMDSDIYSELIFTGPIDEYFGFRFGRLPYRSLSFRHQTLKQEWLQPVGTINYPEESIPYTRVSEYKHITGQVHPLTTITYEYPQAVGDPYYPVPRPENQALYKKYEALALKTPNVHFVGRLATYRYYNMDQVVGQALAAYRRIRAAEHPQSIGVKPGTATAPAE